jgi:hypothetical protein
VGEREGIRGDEKKKEKKKKKDVSPAGTLIPIRLKISGFMIGRTTDIYNSFLTSPNAPTISSITATTTKNIYKSNIKDKERMRYI